ncbi:alpha-amylase 1 [Sideroxyarcus emersonii]|uniref:Alpha-amylase 1 n=1 Tax=Sideroxyarcus emersonii TaxID=2764705 RepID=A0AAN1XAH4_9PROT|nr:alpha-amylase/4-alpha-glucanotransferase domain-containing protein [Sideroxyarcus emersonii]BCK87778.1 alpha-amylase 1 [Sideroxyarcus emersonii]
MAKSISLLLGVHAHQPVGNFTSVLDEAHVRCYGPFLRVLHRYPAFRFAIHVSGWLLDYMLERYPDDMALLKEMVQRGQAELVGAGYTEPVLAVIPEADRLGQLQRMSSMLEHTLGQRPQGAWLTERVWEATVVPSLADSGIRYSTVDDYHFLCAGKEGKELDGYYTTEENGRQLDLFPISEALRYRLPFSPAQEVVSYLESLAKEEGEPAAIYFDDIEKFGIWPETYQWVYERGWLTQFIEGVLASDIIRTERYCDYHARAKTHGVVYLPTTSYIEMNEWTLPVPAAHHYADLVQASKSSGDFERNKAFLRGGIWKNFFMRYPESNWMHKRMLSLSRRLHALPQNAQTAEMLNALYEAQANDAYWHGLFGGLYLPHLRRAIYNAIVKLEGLLDAAEPRQPMLATDLDLDGDDEIFLQNGVLQAILRQDGNAALCEFDAYRLNHNFADTLAMPQEHYHRKVHAQPSAHPGGEGIANPHERMSRKHEITPEDMAIDGQQKSMFLDKWLADGAETRPQYVLSESAGTASAATFEATLGDGRVRKSVVLDGSRLYVAYRFFGVARGVFQVVVNLAMPSCDGPAGRFRVGGEIQGGFGQLLQLAGMQHVVLEDAVLGGRLEVSVSRPVALHSLPSFSVSQSEAGFEKIMQAVVLTFDCILTSQTDTLEFCIDVA